MLLAATVGALADYAMKVEAVAHFHKGPALVRFFGLFYAGTALLALLIQATLGRAVLARLGLGGSVASHPAVVGSAALVAFAIPGPWRGILPRGLDASSRNSVFRAGYELLYTPLPEATKRKTKAVIDVAWDSAGKALGAGAVLLVTLLPVAMAFAAVNALVALAAAAELAVARRLRPGYVRELEGGLKRGSDVLEDAALYSLSDFTAVESYAGLDRASLLRAAGVSPDAPPSPTADPVVAAIVELRSGSRSRVRAALRSLPRDPLVAGALIPLLARRDLLREVIAALESFGPRAAGQLVDALHDPAVPEEVRRRVPPVLKACASPLARDGLVAGLALESFELRRRSARALLALTDDHPELAVPRDAALSAAARELSATDEPALLREHVLSLLTLALEREPARIAARAFETDDAHLRGTALEYFETVLPSDLFRALEPRLSAGMLVVAGPRRAAVEVREELVKAGATMTMSLDEVRRRLAAARGRGMTEPPPPPDADRILLVDDDPSNLDILRGTLEGRGYKLLVATSGEDALRVALRSRPSLVLLDVLMPGMDGYEACRRLKADPATADAAVIFLSALEDAREKVRGLEAGAVDFVTKPFQPEEVVARVHTHLTVQRLQRQLAGRNADLQRELAVAQELLDDARRRVDGPLVGTSPAARALRESIARHAATLDPLVLTGPHGAGQEAVARAVHHASPRSRQPFIHVNCTLVACGQVASLFATAGPAEPGCSSLSQVDLAERGTLYLEEIHRMPPALQERLAGRPRSGGKAAPAGPSRLARRAGGGEHLGLPLSRQRTLPGTPRAARAPSAPRARARRAGGRHPRPRGRFYVTQHARRLGAVVDRISDESLKRMRAYRWPGNVRELESVLERAVASAREPVLEVDKALLDEGLPLGHYRLVSKLGEGGMGEVWRARHQLLARPCAVKLIRPDRLGGASRDAAVERFRLEARAISRLTSPNTVRLYDFGVSETGSLYFVMELLDGLDLASLVQRFGPDARATRGRGAAPGVPLARRGARGRAPAPRHQAAQPLPVPPRGGLRRRQGPRLRPREVGRRGRRPPHRRRRADRDAGLHAPRARDGRPRRRDLRPLLPRLRGVLDAHRQAPLHRGPDGHARPPRPHPPAAALGSARGARARGRRARGPRLPRQGAVEAAGFGPRARPAAGRDRARGAVAAGRGRAVVARAPPAALDPGPGSRRQRRPALAAEPRLKRRHEARRRRRWTRGAQARTRTSSSQRRREGIPCRLATTTAVTATAE